MNTVMITCNNCGRVNDESSRICRFCGTVIEHSKPQAYGTQVRDYAPPGVDSAGLASGPRTVEPYSPPSAVAGGYRCPNCQSAYPPVAEKRISTEGWVVFAALLIFCLPLFWIGLLMKEELRICPMCRARLA
jgi:RNA polymerase subunit RPABC4/transcription elongation factor Spt4